MVSSSEGFRPYWYPSCKLALITSPPTPLFFKRGRNWLGEAKLPPKPHSLGWGLTAFELRGLSPGDSVPLSHLQHSNPSEGDAPAWPEPAYLYVSLATTLTSAVLVFSSFCWNWGVYYLRVRDAPVFAEVCNHRVRDSGQELRGPHEPENYLLWCNYLLRIYHGCHRTPGHTVTKTPSLPSRASFWTSQAAFCLSN